VTARLALEVVRMNDGIELGYKLSSEEHAPNDLVRYAALAEDAGFGFAMASDHFHPWTSRDGQSPFVWCTLGAIAHATKRIRVGTAVTCPTMRIHPAIVAQAAATAADMFEGRFLFAVGTGENLNEHVTGRRWPEPLVRLAMLEEAVEIIRKLWSGDVVSHHGRFYDVEAARLFTRTEPAPPLLIAADHAKSAALSGRLADGLVSTTPDASIVSDFEAAGGKRKPKFIEIDVCWGDDEKTARERARRLWPIAGLPGPILQELAAPRFFEALEPMVTESTIAATVACGPDPEKHVEMIEKCVAAGFDHVLVHQIGPEQAAFIDFYQRRILPRISRVDKAA
jgi:G6PDH family F420-dependent oxidoreductase